jgi:tRNA pseudouridine13 synthase
MHQDLVQPPPLLTAELPGIGGAIKQRPDDFEVEEIPAYAPSGCGDHLFLWIEKKSLGAEYFTRLVARQLGLAPGEIGVAGLKDRHAVTRQMISVPAAVKDRLGRLEEAEGLRLLEVSRHGNKLRTGHLRGNRFRILMRDAVPNAAQLLEPILVRIRAEGLPNYFGPQRFGIRGETAALGLSMLRANQRRPRSPFMRKLALSAAQAALFNLYLGQRSQDGLLAQVISGDVMAKLPAGGMFVAQDLACEQRRFEARETVHTGPIFGRKTFAAANDSALRELSILEMIDLTSAAFTRFGKLVQGTRRHNLIYLDDLAAAPEVDGIRITFSMPAGSYATVLLRELMKTSPETSDDATAL